LIGWPLKKPLTIPNGNFEFAPSVAEADAILAKFGFAARNELAAA
jgi:predicted ester cyclase